MDWMTKAKYRTMAMDGLAKIQENKDYVKAKKNAAAAKLDHTRLAGYTVEFNEDDFMNKRKIDNLYFERLTNKLSDDLKSVFTEHLDTLNRTVRAIYQEVNYSPKAYKEFCFDNFTESENELEGKIKGIIESYVQDNYYKVPQEEFEEAHFSEVNNFASTLIQESGVDHITAVKTASLQPVVESLLKTICFPKDAYEHVIGELSNEAYAEAFDSQKLYSLWDTFNEQIHNMSKLVTLNYV
jgi:hypothetical protein